MKLFQQGLLVCFCVFACVSLHAQVTDFKLSDYKYRTPLYQALQLDLDLDQGTSTGDTKNMRASLEAHLSHLKVFSTDQRQHIRIGTVFLQPRFGSSKEGDVKKLDNTMSTGLGYEIQERRFKKNYFIEAGGAVGANGTRNKHGQKGEATADGQYHAYIELNAGIGKGRLEYVHDAQAALLLLEDLYREGIIKSRVDSETAYRFAQLITNIKKQRVLDSRKRNIYKLTQVDSFLRVNKIVPQCDARTMAIINDILFYSFQNDLSGFETTFQNPVNFNWTRGDYDEGYEGTDFGLIPQLESLSDQLFRQHGTIVYARLIPEIRYDRFSTKIELPGGGDTTDKSTFVHVDPGIRIGYEKHRAVDLHWQKGYGGSVQYVYNKYIVSKPTGSIDYSRILANAFYKVGYYPNSRSVIEGIAQLRVSRFGGKGPESTFITPQVSLKAGYFVSYNTVLRASLDLNYTKQTGMISKTTFSQGFRIYLRHYFF